MAVALSTISAAALALTLALALAAICPHAAARTFSVQLIHRDSPKSPFYDPSQTPFQRVHAALRRSLRRSGFYHFNPGWASAAAAAGHLSRVINNDGEYLLSLSLGTPPVEVLLIADTGSDLTWTQCKPCTACYKQIEPLFDPDLSSTFKPLACDTPSCQSIGRGVCSINGSSVCQYSVSYGDLSSTHGTVVADNIALGGELALSRGIFGCGHNNQGTFDVNEAGIAGLGLGPYSLVSQLEPTIDGKFSYCLVPVTGTTVNSSLMHFGDAVSGDGAVSTPFSTAKHSTFYVVKLEGISVGETRIDFRGARATAASSASLPSATDATGMDIIIDSGTTLTHLPSDMYALLKSEVMAAVGLPETEDPNKVMDLCYLTQSGSELEGPAITMHFAGADVTLSDLNTFVRISDETVCFTFIPSEIGTIYGNLAQMNFLVGYDVKENTVSFKPTDCTLPRPV